MAIGFVKSRYVSRTTGGNACRSSAYNARGKIVDQNTGQTFDFSKRPGNIYHEILLPDHVDSGFKDISVLSNKVEQSEHRKDSQVYVEWVLALAKEKEVTLEMHQELIKKFIEYKGWIREGLGIQIDIHTPDEGDENLHAHLLVTTRRFRKSGLGFEELKARDLQPKVVNQRVIEETKDSIAWTNMQNDYYKECGLDLRVDLPSELVQEHIGPVRMRSVLNQAVERNEERKLAEIEHLSSGLKLLEKVTRHMSVFAKGDLIRAAKCVPDLERREELVEEALASQSIIALYREDGIKTQYFTTQKIREEENKVLRLCSYVANGSNVFNSSREASKRTRQLILEYSGKLTEEQKLTKEQEAALTESLTSESALHIIRGRAGAGKSHVLRQIACIARVANINAIGLSPTHKAKEALAAEGFARTDTVKGMLFKLHNARFSLPNNSLLVVDEAGMIGNDDYSELLRVAATRKCTVILSGDERQLSSVQRGGMFEIFANRYGSSTILDIRRQDSGWGKDVAMAFSEGDVRSGVSTLERENRIKWQADSDKSMQELLSDWQRSSYAIDDKVILAVRNKDVVALNHGVRQYLKAEGILTGDEIEVGGNHYMKGDRIVIQKTNKDLKIINGDLGVILEVSKDRFVVSIGKTSTDTIDTENKLEGSNGKEVETKIIEFTPSEYSGFRHSYVTTIFKAQGASIRDVYLYHNGFAGLRNSYVALSRHISELNLYVNEQTTSGIKDLIKQLSYDHESGSSLSYLTHAGLKNHQENAEILKNIGVMDSLLLGAYNFVERGVRKITDKYLPKSEYYNYKEPIQKAESVEQVLDKVYEQNQHIGFVVDDVEERIVVGGNVQVNNAANRFNGEMNNNISVRMSDELGDADISQKKGLDTSINTTVPSTTTKQSAKERFYARADYVRNREKQNQENIERYKEEYRAHIDKLRGELRFNAESVALDLLGTPNRKLSTKSILKYGNKGSLAVRVSGMKAGTWYDFEKGEGGDMFALVQQEKRCDFKESVEYLSDFVGISRGRNNNIVHLHNVSDRYVDYHKEQAKIKAEEAVKIKKAENLYARSKAITVDTVAAKYLTNTRKIDVHANINSDHSADSSTLLSSDIRTCNIYEQSIDKKLPAIVAFARDKDGNITGGQQILLDSDSCNKAVVNAPKKSFGKIAGSFVEISKSNADNITIIAEGLETALSIKQSGIEAKIVCSLGIHNIKNYVAKENEKIIIAADNDGKNAVSNNTVIEASKLLEQYALAVKVVKPEQIGDFNDILQRQGSRVGVMEIRELFRPVIEELTAKILHNTIQYPHQDGYHQNKRDRIDVLRTNNDDLQTHDSKLNPEFALQAYNKVKEQVDVEIESARKSNLIANKININNLKLIAVNYAFDKVQSQEFLPLSNNQAKALISRSLFELNNRKRINNILNESWYIENPDVLRPLSYEVQCARLTDKLTKVSGYIVENTVLNSPEKHLSIKRDDSIIRQAYKISESRGEKLQEILKTDPLIKETEQGESYMRRAVAQQLVDYRLQHGMDVKITEWKLESMQKAAGLEHELSKTIDNKLNKVLNSGFSDHNIDGTEQNETLSESKKLVVHYLRNEIGEQYHLSGYDKSHCRASMNKTIKRISSLQQEISKQHLEELQHTKMQQGKGMGMSM